MRQNGRLDSVGMLRTEKPHSSYSVLFLGMSSSINFSTSVQTKSRTRIQVKFTKIFIKWTWSYKMDGKILGAQISKSFFIHGFRFTVYTSFKSNQSDLSNNFQFKSINFLNIMFISQSLHSSHLKVPALNRKEQRESRIITEKFILLLV